MNEKYIPGVLLTLTANARSLNPELNQIVQSNSSNLVRCLPLEVDTVNTIGSHLKHPSYFMVYFYLFGIFLS